MNEQNLTEKQRKRLDIKRRFQTFERSKGQYKPDEGIYDVVITMITLKTNTNGNNYIQMACNNLDKKGYKTLYASYYLTDGTDESSLTDLRCLLNDYNQDDFTDEEIIDDCSIFEKLQVLVGEPAKLVVEDQGGFLSGKVYKEMPSD